MLVQEVVDLVVAVLAAEVGVVERRRARLAEQLMVRPQRRADRAAVVARRRLDVDLLEGGVAQDLAVGDGVQRDAARDAELLQAGVLLESAPS